MSSLTFRENGRFGIKGVDLASLPAPVYGAIIKLCDLEHPVSPTNAEKLRSMTDEEMAHLLIRMAGDATYCQGHEQCKKELDRHEMIPRSRCEACVLHWLQNPWMEGEE